jgi:hypothetical protein
LSWFLTEITIFQHFVKLFTIYFSFTTLNFGSIIFYLDGEVSLMKKLLSLTMLLMLLFAAACTQADENATDDEGTNDTEEQDSGAEENGEGNNEEDTENDEQAQKKALMSYELEIVDILHQNSSALKGLASLQATAADETVAEVDKPSTEELEGARDEARAAAQTIADGVRGLEVPSDLDEETQSAVKDAVEKLAQAMDWNAENLAVEAPEGETEADKLLVEFDEAMSAVHEQIGLAPASLSSELN